MSATDDRVTAEELGLRLDYMHLSLDAGRGLAHLVLDRPGKLNALLMPMRGQFADLFRTLERDGRTRVVIVRGAGEQAFSAGGEISAFMETGQGPLSLLHENVAARSGSPDRSSRRSTATASASASRSPWPATFGSPRRGPSSACRRSGWG